MSLEDSLIQFGKVGLDHVHEYRSNSNRYESEMTLTMPEEGKTVSYTVNTDMLSIILNEIDEMVTDDLMDGYLEVNRKSDEVVANILNFNYDVTFLNSIVR